MAASAAPPIGPQAAQAAPAVQVGVVRDPRFLSHLTGMTHPEHPRRLAVLHELLDQEFAGRLHPIPARLATLELLELVHSPLYVEMVLRTSNLRHVHLAPDTPVSAGSFLAACLAAGSTVAALEWALAAPGRSAFALVRPPGHHALRARAGGVCIFNNLGIAARHGLARLGLERILVLDWDVHHGNALEDLFYEDPRVFYLSTHYLPSYPHTGEATDLGRGPGRGYTLNLPLPKAADDAEVVALYREVLFPLLAGFAPQAILVAAGFDAHRDDPLSNAGLGEGAFGLLAGLLRHLGPERGIPLVLALEGGYHLPALVAAVRAVFHGLLEGAPESAWRFPTPPRSARVLERARELHAAFGLWCGREEGVPPAGEAGRRAEARP